jgi:hypothetical protein
MKQPIYILIYLYVVGFVNKKLIQTVFSFYPFDFPQWKGRYTRLFLIIFIIKVALHFSYNESGHLEFLFFLLR